jgi:DNA-binding transcriptional ArsR family regulator
MTKGLGSQVGLAIAYQLYNNIVMNHLDSAFFALSDPTRRAILARLATGEASVMELAEPFAMSQPAISRHLKVLEEAGLITRRVEGARRPCRLNAEGMAELQEWLDHLRQILTRNYDRLDAVLAAMQSDQGGNP